MAKSDTATGTAEGDEQGREIIERFPAPAAIRADLTETVLRAGSLVWTRPGLASDKRSLTTIGTLVALGHEGPLREHIQLGLANGLSETEICEAILHCGVYAGMPAMLRAMAIAQEVLGGAD